MCRDCLHYSKELKQCSITHKYVARKHTCKRDHPVVKITEDDKKAG